jgi:hypothetical protein
VSRGPRWTKVWRQCQALDSDGKRCRGRTGLRVEQYFGNPEHYTYDEPEPRRVHVTLCTDHRRDPRPSEGSKRRGVSTREGGR